MLELLILLGAGAAVLWIASQQHSDASSSSDSNTVSQSTFNQLAASQNVAATQPGAAAPPPSMIDLLNQGVTGLTTASNPDAAELERMARQLGITGDIWGGGGVYTYTPPNQTNPNRPLAAQPVNCANGYVARRNPTTGTVACEFVGLPQQQTRPAASAGLQVVRVPRGSQVYSYAANQPLLLEPLPEDAAQGAVSYTIPARDLFNLLAKDSGSSDYYLATYNKVTSGDILKLFGRIRLAGLELATNFGNGRIFTAAFDAQAYGRDISGSQEAAIPESAAATSASRSFSLSSAARFLDSSSSPYGAVPATSLGIPDAQLDNGRRTPLEAIRVYFPPPPNRSTAQYSPYFVHLPPVPSDPQARLGLFWLKQTEVRFV